MTGCTPGSTTAAATTAPGLGSRTSTTPAPSTSPSSGRSCSGPSVEGVNKADVQSLFDWIYWVNHKLLDAADGLDDAKFQAHSKVTTRGLRETLVHELDVEWSWRENLQGKDIDDWGPDE